MKFSTELTTIPQVKAAFFR